ncbi:hypothetical protein AB0M20_20245 [Actinoplanes sp. NPDC051633]|uniref:hypothetical protein n=1 Tax=Actinoplanes sp. NPDC051633 TaxID=3155670 RepID=UPI0034451509
MPPTHFATAALLAVGVLLPAPPATADTRPAASSIRWHGCSTGPSDGLGAALDAAGAQCGEVTVPVDYRHPHGRTITVALSRIRATDPAHRQEA